MVANDMKVCYGLGADSKKYLTVTSTTGVKCAVIDKLLDVLNESQTVARLKGSSQPVILPNFTIQVPTVVNSTLGQKYALHMPSSNVLKKYYASGRYTVADAGSKKVKIKKKSAVFAKRPSQQETAPNSKDLVDSY